MLERTDALHDGGMTVEHDSTSGWAPGRQIHVSQFPQRRDERLALPVVRTA